VKLILHQLHRVIIAEWRAVAASLVAVEQEHPNDTDRPPTRSGRLVWQLARRAWFTGQRWTVSDIIRAELLEVLQREGVEVRP